jgi:hypothetical protein
METLMKKILISILVAAIVAQIWGMFSWMVLPWHNLDMKQFKNGDAVANVIKSEQVESGIYMVPNWDLKIHEDNNLMQQWNQKASQGPFVFMNVRSNGITPGMGPMMMIGFLLNLLMAGILFWLLSKTTISGLVNKAVFISIAGGVGGLYPIISNWNWWHFPAMYTVSAFIDLFLTWFLAGLAMAYIMQKMSSNNS